MSDYNRGNQRRVPSADSDACRKLYGMPRQTDYPWESHPEAVLGTVYLYFAYGPKPPADVLRSFVDCHQDGGRLHEGKVRDAISAVSKLDGGSGLGSSQLLDDIWTLLAPLRPRLPPVTP
jgi:hypothetical protein